jgi:hypothetical protein
MTTIKQPNTEQYDALRKFAEKHGPKWKDRLVTQWIQGQDVGLNPETGHLLRQVRNQFGPSVLARKGWPTAI